MTEKSPYEAILVFGIGPVQGFIATARRTQDLWIGSYILAFLAHLAIKAADPDASKSKLIFPTVDDHPLFDGAVAQGRAIGVATLPNKFTAGYSSTADAERAAKDATKAVRDGWTAIAEKVRVTFFDELIPDHASHDWGETWKHQVDPEKWIEIYWAIEPNDPAKSSYQAHSNRAESGFAIRKNLRNFSDVIERGEKDSISGERAALGKKIDQPRRDLRQDWNTIAKTLNKEAQENSSRNLSGLGAAIVEDGRERLSAISTVKRFAQRFYFEGEYANFRSRFPSTSSVASVLFREQILAKNLPETADFVAALEAAKVPHTLAKDSFWALKKYENEPNSDLLKYDGAFFYPATFTAERLEKDYGMENSKPERKAALDALTALLKLRSAAQQANIPLPSTYYALILLDGDKMGDKFKNGRSADVHREISRRLQQLARNDFLDIVEDKGLGRVVYAGGDDLMAFVPLETVVGIVNKIQKAFSTKMAGTMQNEKGEDVPFTISGGVVIAHHMAPLDLVLQAARTAEKRAKNGYGRSAIVFSLLKRSGEQVDVGARWNHAGSTLKTIQMVIDAFKGNLSASLAHNFMQEADSLTPLVKPKPTAVENRLHHLIGRHASDRALAGDLAPRLAQLAADLQTLFDDPDNSSDEHPAGSRSGTLELARWLMLARFIAAAPADE